MSIDPDVATTDQPYVFSNDNPLNAEDPLGLEDVGVGYGPASDDYGATLGGGDASGGDASGGDGQPVGPGTAGARVNIPGLSSNYDDVTIKNSVKNVSTNVTPEEFGKNLKENGWKESTSEDGRATYYTKDGAKYSVYTSTSTGGPSAEFTPEGSTRATLKIRLGR